MRLLGIRATNLLSSLDILLLHSTTTDPTPCDREANNDVLLSHGLAHLHWLLKSGTLSPVPWFRVPFSHPRSLILSLVPSTFSRQSRNITASPDACFVHQFTLDPLQASQTMRSQILRPKTTIMASATRDIGLPLANVGLVKNGSFG